MSDFQGRLAELDRVFGERGLARVPRMAQAGWEGRVGGRHCAISVAPQKRTRYAGEVRVRQQIGYRLRVELETSVRTRLFFVRGAVASNPLVRLIYRLRRQAVLVAPAALPGFSVVTSDATWAHGFLAQPAAMAATAELVADLATPTFAGSVYFSPTSERGMLYYGSPTIQLEEVTAERALRVIERLTGIAATAERLPAPQVAVQIGAFGRFSEKHPALLAIGLLGCALVALGGMALVVLTLAAVLSR